MTYICGLRAAYLYTCASDKIPGDSWLSLYVPVQASDTYCKHIDGPQSFIDDSGQLLIACLDPVIAVSTFAGQIFTCTSTAASLMVAGLLDLAHPRI